MAKSGLRGSSRWSLWLLILVLSLAGFAIVAWGLGQGRVALGLALATAGLWVLWFAIVRRPGSQWEAADPHQVVIAYRLGPDLSLRMGPGTLLRVLLALLLWFLGAILWWIGASTALRVPLGVLVIVHLALGAMALFAHRLNAWWLGRTPPERRPEIRMRFNADGVDVVVRRLWTRFHFHWHWDDVDLVEERDAFFLKMVGGRWPLVAFPKDALPAGTDVRRLAGPRRLRWSDLLDATPKA